MKITKTFAGVIALSTLTIGAGATTWAAVTDPMTGNGDQINITLPNAANPERTGKNVVDLLANDEGPIDANATMLMEPDSGELVKSLTFGSTSFTIDDGVLTVTYSGKSKTDEIPEKLNYVIYNKDKTLERYVPVDFNVDQESDANAEENFKAVDDTIKNDVTLGKNVSLQYNLVDNDVFDSELIPTIHLIDPSTGKVSNNNTLTYGKVTYSLDEKGMLNIKATAPYAKADFKSFKYSITGPYGYTSEATVNVTPNFITATDPTTTPPAPTSDPTSSAPTTSTPPTTTPPTTSSDPTSSDSTTTSPATVDPTSTAPSTGTTSKSSSNISTKSSTPTVTNSTSSKSSTKTASSNSSKVITNNSNVIKSGTVNDKGSIVGPKVQTDNVN